MAEDQPSDEGWGNHQWLDQSPRHFVLESGQIVFQRRCTRCGRDFVVDISSGARYAVQASIFSFHRLHEEVAQRWLGQLCPGARLTLDEDDRKKHIVELRISWERARE